MVIGQDKVIFGLTMCEGEFKVAKYAGDVSCLLTKIVVSLMKLTEKLSQLNKVSGYKVNQDNPG